MTKEQYQDLMELIELAQESVAKGKLSSAAMELDRARQLLEDARTKKPR